ncbi:MAG: DNA repair protein RadA [Rickettsiales bacterium]|jgi:DNA repair protein RadA/Sms|nr:DNA repair protein RadA [Rickettsiales bacterium]
MAKALTQYICQSCGTVHPKWGGQCDGCGSWNTLVAENTEATPKGLTSGKGKKIDFVTLDEHAEDASRLSCGIGELDRVLGGGLVAGSAVLIGGDPGIGKSTLLLQTVIRVAESGLACAYISGEESVAQVSLRAKRLGLKSKNVQLASATSVRDIVASLDGMREGLVVIDSIQTMYLDNLDAAPGTVSQVRAASHELIKLAKKRGLTLFLVGHVTKDGQIAGPRVLEHMVDTVLYFEGERGHSYRILRAVKNRFGGTDEIGVFEMKDMGLSEVTNPSALFLSSRDVPVSGACVFAGMEGSRPLLVEVQALVAPSYMSSPRRAVVGWDASRLSMLLAVLEARAGIRFSDKEVYLNVAGGIKISEPAADLAVAAALLSALFDQPLPADKVFFGEIGLSGEVRGVARAESRLKESEKLGFKGAVTPPGASFKGLTLAIKPVETVSDLARQLFGAASKKTASA